MFSGGLWRQVVSHSRCPQRERLVAFLGTMCAKKKTILKTYSNNVFSILGRTTKSSTLTDDKSVSVLKGGSWWLWAAGADFDQKWQALGLGPFSSPAHPRAEQHLCTFQGHHSHKTLGFCWLWVRIFICKLPFFLQPIWSHSPEAVSVSCKFQWLQGS